MITSLPTLKRIVLTGTPIQVSSITSTVTATVTVTDTVTATVTFTTMTAVNVTANVTATVTAIYVLPLLLLYTYCHCYCSCNCYCYCYCYVAATVITYSCYCIYTVHIYISTCTCTCHLSTQNDLQEFYSIVDFCNPGMLGKYNILYMYSHVQYISHCCMNININTVHTITTLYIYITRFTWSIPSCI